MSDRINADLSRTITTMPPIPTIVMTAATLSSASTSTSTLVEDLFIRRPMPRRSSTEMRMEACEAWYIAQFQKAGALLARGWNALRLLFS